MKASSILLRTTIVLSLLLAGPIGCKKTNTVYQKPEVKTDSNEKNAKLKIELNEKKESLEKVISFLLKYKRVIHGIKPSKNPTEVQATLEEFMKLKVETQRRVSKAIINSSDDCQRFLETYSGFLDDIEKSYLEVATTELEARRLRLLEARSLSATVLLKPLVDLIPLEKEAGENSFDGSTEKCPIDNRNDWTVESQVLWEHAKTLHKLLFGIPGIDDATNVPEISVILAELKAHERLMNELKFTAVFIPLSIIFMHLTVMRGVPYVLKAFAPSNITLTLLKGAVAFPIGYGEIMLYMYTSDAIFDDGAKPSPGFVVNQWDKALRLSEHFLESPVDAADIYMNILNTGMNLLDQKYVQFLDTHEGSIEVILKKYGNVDQALVIKTLELEEIKESLVKLQ